jgi:hypothetical protein
MREFRDSITGGSKDDDDDKPAITRASALPDTKTGGDSEPAATRSSGSTEVGSDRPS